MIGTRTDTTITTNNFELEEMRKMLSAILFSNDRHPSVVCFLFCSECTNEFQEKLLVIVEFYFFLAGTII